MKAHGTLTKWNHDRGFGFIALPQSGTEVFVHISAFPRDGVLPRVGELVAFEIEEGRDGRQPAVRAAVVQLRT
jgi:cold shock CspA family protein